MKHGISRRQFLRGTLGILGGTLASYVAKFFPEAQISLAQTGYEATVDHTPILASGVGELYGGFVLLPEGAPIPPYVKDYEFGIPTMCNVGTSKKQDSSATHRVLPDTDSLSLEGNFAVYDLATDLLRLDDIRYGGSSLISHNTGEIFGGWVNYITRDPLTELDYTCIAIMAQADFPKPFPLWSSQPVEESGSAVILEKVDFLPGGAGIKMDSLSGFTLHWIQYDVYYALTTQYLPGVDARTIASALKLNMPVSN